MIFVQFLHLLAHHPDFAITQESVPDMAKCVRPRSCPAVLSDILMLDISTFTSHLWLPQKMSRYCTTFLGKQRLSVTQNPIYTARLANLRTHSIPERE